MKMPFFKILYFYSLLFVLVILPCNSVFGSESKCGVLPKVTYQDTLLKTSLRYMEIMQGLATNNVDEIISGLHYDMILLILEIGDMVKYKCFSENSASQANKVLILLSVYNDNFHIDIWNNDKKIKSIFKRARVQDPKYLEKTRKRDWSGLMK